jgi:hypothetical protein
MEGVAGLLISPSIRPAIEREMHGAGNRYQDRLLAMVASGRFHPRSAVTLQPDLQVLLYKGRPDLAHDKTSFDRGSRLCRSGLLGLSAGCQGAARSWNG